MSNFGGLNMPSLSQTVIANVDAGYIETYLRECKITRNEDQKGMQLKYWVDSLFDEGKIDIVDFEQFLFNELFWGKRKYIRFYQLEKVNKIKLPEDWFEFFDKNFNLSQLDTELEYCNILGTIADSKETRKVAAIKSIENNKGELDKIQILFSTYIEVLSSRKISEENTYFPVEIDFNKRQLTIKAWVRQGLNDYYKIDALMDSLITFLCSTCGISCKSYEQSHKKTLFRMSQGLIDQIYTNIPSFSKIESISSLINNFTQSVYEGLPLKNVKKSEGKTTISKGVLDFEDEIYKVIEKLCVSDFFYDVPYEDIWGLTGVEAVISKIRFNDIEHVLTSLSGEDSSVPIFCTKTFMALKKSLEDAEMVERLWVEKSRSKGRLSLSFDATKEEYFSVRVLSGIRFKEEDLIVAEEIYKQYESGDIAETWNQDKRNVV